MPKFILTLLTLLLVTAGAHAQDAASLTAVPERVLGNPKAPVTVEEFVSLTCSHCAEFYNTILPDLEKKYVETGKVKFILRDFPLDGVGLKAAAVARCMPADQYYPFITILYKNQAQWAFGDHPETTLLQYARLGGLGEDQAKACLANDKLMDALATGRTDAAQKYNVEATPTFVINQGQEKLVGVRTADEFSKVFDRLLAASAK